MDTPDFKLGQLEQFKKDIVDRVDRLENAINRKFESMEKTISDLQRTKWITTGKVSGITSVIWIIFTALWQFLGRKIFGGE